MFAHPVAGLFQLDERCPPLQPRWERVAGWYGGLASVEATLSVLHIRLLRRDAL